MVNGSIINTSIKPNDTSHKTIEFLFQQQMIMLTKKTVFDVNQFLKI